MSGREWLIEQFEVSRAHLRAVAYRMLGSVGEADDAVQECWLRVNRADTDAIENMEGWLTTVLARICLNMLRSRRSRREEGQPQGREDAALTAGKRSDPEEEALLAESVGLALLVVLEQLTPVERVAFVLHEVSGVSFDEIAPIVKRSPAGARKLASRARQRVRGSETPGGADLSLQRQAIEVFLNALRAGDMEGILEVLDPNIRRRADERAVPRGSATEVNGAAAVAKEAVAYSKLAQFARPALVDRTMGFVVAPRGRLRIAVRCTVKQDKIFEMNVIADPARLRRLKISDPSF